MKATRIGLLVTASSLLLLGVQGAPALAIDSSSIVKRSSGAAKSDSDGRQIAAVLPMPTVPNVAPRKVFSKPMVETESLNGASSARWKKVTFEVPATLPDAAEFCTYTATRFGKVATDRVLQASAWLNAFVTRMNSVPTITPAVPVYGTSPKLEKLGFHEKAWVMPDGRVKTLTRH